MLVSSDGYCTVVVFDENMPLYHTQQRDLQLKSVALAHSHPLINTHAHSSTSSAGTSNAHPHQSLLSASSSSSSGTGATGLGPQSPLVHPPPSPFVPPHAPSPAVSLKDLPGPTGSGAYTAGSLKRTASAIDVPLTPAASVTGNDADAFMAGGMAGGGSEGERERAEEGPAKKRRRVELKHHGAT